MRDGAMLTGGDEGGRSSADPQRSGNASADAKNALPGAIRGYLTKYARRHRRMALVRSLGTVSAISLAWMMFWALFDRVSPMPGWARMGVLGINAGVVVVFLGPSALGMWRRIDWRATAARIERGEATFAERLQTVVSQALAPAEERGSAQLLSRLESGLDLSRHPSPRVMPVRRWATPWAVTILLLSVMAWAWSNPWLDAPRLLERYGMPWTATLPARTTRLEVVPGDVDVSDGDHLEILVRVARLEGAFVTIFFSAEDGSTAGWAHAAMTPLGDGQFAYLFHNVDRDLRYYISGGDAVSSTYRIRALRKPKVSQFSIRYEYPPATVRVPLTVTNVDGLIEAPVGTEALVTVTATEPLAEAIATVGEVRILADATDDVKVRRFRLTIQRDRTWRLELKSARGIKGGASGTMTVRALPDRPPLVRLLRADEPAMIARQDILPVDYEAMDDYALASLGLELAVNGSTVSRRVIELGADPRRCAGVFNVDLGAMGGLQVGDVVAVRVVGSDRAGQRSGSVVGHVLISPRSRDAELAAQVLELRRAARLAQTLADETGAAEEIRREPAGADNAGAVDYSPRSARIDQRLAAASEAGAAIRLSLLRAVARSHSPGLTTALGSLLDDQLCRRRRLNWAAAPISGARRESLERAVLPEAVRDARRLADILSDLAAGQAARSILADRAAVSAVEEVWGRRSDKPVAGDVAEQRRRVRAGVLQDLAAQAKRIGLSLDASDVDAKLEHLVSQAQRRVRSLGEPDLLGAAGTARAAVKSAAAGGIEDASPMILVDRLRLAAQVEALRPDFDAIWAGDLLLSSRAVVGIESSAARSASTRPSESDDFISTFGVLLAAREARASRGDVSASQKAMAGADAARRRMRQWAAASDREQADGWELAVEASADQADTEAAVIERFPWLRAGVPLGQPSRLRGRGGDSNAHSVEPVDPLAYPDALKAYFDALAGARSE